MDLGVGENYNFSFQDRCFISFDGENGVEFPMLYQAGKSIMVNGYTINRCQFKLMIVFSLFTLFVSAI